MRLKWLIFYFAFGVAGCGSADREAPGEQPADGAKEDAGGPEPSERVTPCCGCLCADPRWSCSNDTCTDELGHAVALAPEAGFLEVPLMVQPGWGFVHSSVFVPAVQMQARMWYSFFPADDAAQDKPLLVLMQGGPGTSMLPLWGGNTGPLTLDPRRSGGAAENPESWTRFAHLLYIDTSHAGFSYERSLEEAPGSSYSPCARIFDPDEEAASYVRVLLGFLERHPQLRAAPVALVAESYGGVRATLMLQQLMHPERLREALEGYADPALAAEIEAFAQREQGEPWSASGPRQRFFAQVLIQPWLLGDSQHVDEQPACSWPGGKTQTDFELELVGAMLRELDSSSALSHFIGVGVDSIRWLRAEERTGVCQRARPEAGGTDLALSDTFGALAESDRFFLPRAAVSIGAADRIRRNDFGDRPGSRLADLFVENLRRVDTFITNAGCDEIVQSDAMVRDLVQVDGVAEVVALEGGDDMLVSFDDGEPSRLRFPSYPESGHVVTLHAPEQIARDVEQFLAQALAGGE